MSGADILKIAEQEVNGAVEENLKTFLKSTALERKRRLTWIKVRTDQIKELEQLQIEAVKSFDAGKFDADQDEFIKRLGNIKTERVDQTAKQRGYHD